uniref:Olfactory receptor n=1 Tax=Castor canadensis TaxID=51338 RepID=A0A8C0W353_CASCN
MALENQTGVIEFFLMGLSEDPEMQPILFELLLTMYMVTMFGNLLIILVVSSDSKLHTPMYFFLSNLSFVDICCISTIVPKMLVCFFMIFLCMDNLLLTVMAYDRYVAICHPLYYKVIMNPTQCVLLVLVSMFISSVDALLHTLMVLHLSFCIDLKLPHFFCEITPILKLACSDTLINNILVYLATTLLGIAPLVGIIFSYSQIVSSIMKIPSTSGKCKAFSTCGSHLSVVSLFYGTVLGKTEVASVMYTVCGHPMLNPFIYTLRNKDIKSVLKRLFQIKIIKRSIVLRLKKDP